MKKLGQQFIAIALLALLLALLFSRHQSRRQLSATAPGESPVSPAIPAADLARPQPATAPLRSAPAAAKADTESNVNPVSAFDAWTDAYLAALAPEARARLQAEGEQLAKARREEMLRLIKSDPEQALAVAVPYAVRKQLPASVNALLEERVSGRGDYSVIYYTPLPGQEGQAPPTSRRVVLGDKTYEAFVYGRRLQQGAQSGLSLHGLALDKYMALSADPVRILQPEEAADALLAKRVKADTLCPLCGKKPDAASKPALADLGGKILSLCHVSEAITLNQQLANAESALAPQVANKRSKSKLFPGVKSASISGAIAKAVTNVPPSGLSGSQGRKRLLLMPVLFADDPTPPATIDSIYSLAERNNKYYVEGSYNSASFDTTVTPYLRLPEKKVYYNEFLDFGALLFDAVIAAEALGFDVGSYDFPYVLFTSIAGVTFGGRSDGLLVGGGGALSHELGHNFGLAHANFWYTRGNRPLPRQPPAPTPPYPFDADSLIGHDDINAPEPDKGAGKNPPDEEYGDIFDVMGSGGGHFSAVSKYALNWLPDQFTRVVSRSETNRVYAFDTPAITAGRIYALRVNKDYQRTYWASYRQGIPSNPWLSSGIELTWGPWAGTGGSAQLLDTTPGTTAGKNDAPVVIGRTYADPQAAMYLTPVAKGGETPGDKWIDVVVQVGPFPTNLPPTLSLSASELTVTNGAMVTFTATATDPNGDPLAYYWDFSDETFGTNSPINNKTFFNDGQFVVRCEVSDMKGGLASAYVVVVVGNPTTFTMSGQVTDIYGNPVQGARVHNCGSIPPYTAPDPYNPPPPPTNGTYRYSFTDSQGNYTIGNILPGSYTNRAFIYGYKTAPIDFYDPVVLNAGNAINLDHLATPLPNVSVAVMTNAYESASPGLGTFTVSRTGDTSQDLPVRFLIGGTAVVGLDYVPLPGTVTSNVVVRTNGMEVMTNVVYMTNQISNVIIAAGSSSTNICVTPIDNSSGTGPKTVLLTMLLQTNDIRISSMLTNVVTTNGGVTVTNTMFVYTTNQVTIPGWELLPIGPNNELAWFQTYPTYVLGTAERALTIFDDDPPDTPTVSVFALSSFVLRNYPGAKPDTDAIETANDSAMVTFLRAGGSVESNLVVYYTVSGTASNGVDFQKLGGAVTIPAGQRFVNLPIVALNDLFVEGNETVSIAISTNVAYKLGARNASVLIIEDDLPLISIYSTDSTALKTGSIGTVTVEREGDLSKDLLVNYLLTGTAIGGVDYQVLPGSIIIPAGQITATIIITPVNNTNPSPRTVTVLLSDSTTYNISSLNGQATVTIIDQLPVVTLAVTTATANEASGVGVFTVTRTGSTTNSLVVNFEVGGSALEGLDYSAIGRTITIPAGAASATINIVPVNDRFNEFGDVSGDDTVIIHLLAGAGYNLGSPTAGRVTISNDDGSDLPAVGFLLRESSGREDSGFAELAVRINANPATNKQPVLIDYKISGGTAVQGLNYVFTNGTGTLSFVHFDKPDPPPMFHTLEDGIQFIEIPLLDDGLPAGNKTFTVTLFTHVGYDTNIIVTTNMSGGMVTNTILTPSPTNGYVGDYRSHTFTIIDVGTNTVDIQATTPLAFEEGAQPGVFTITRTGSTNNPTTVYFAVSGTASSGSDYVPFGNSVTIPAGTNKVTINVVPNDDAAEEIPETIVVTLLDGPTFKIGSGRATVTIVDNDGTIQFTSANYLANEADGSALIGVQRTGPTNLLLTVDYLINDGTASNDVDYVAGNGRLIFAPGEILKLIPIQIINDILVEPIETVSLVLTNPTGGVPLGGQSAATLFIVDDDTAFEFATNNFRASENSTNAVISINRLGLTNTEVTVTFWTTDGSAKAGLDYRSVTNMLTFAGGQTNRIVLVPLIDDGLAEGNETVVLHLTNSIPGSAVGGSSTGTLTIVDDECALQFASATYSVNEYAGVATVVVQRTGGTVNPVSVHYSTRDGTATSTGTNADYTSQSGTVYFQGDAYLLATNGSGLLEFHPGDSNQTINIPIIDDVLGEGNETFSIFLSNAAGPPPPGAFTNATLLGARTNAVVTIIDNETPGSVDYEFNPGFGANGRVLAVALQPDLRIVFGGDFTSVNGISFNRIARLQPNGNVDGGFNPGAGIDGTVLAVTSQSDGKVLVGGSFNTVDSTNRARIARLNANGNLDLSFNPGSGANNVVRAIAVQPDGKVLLGGDFTQVNGAAHSHIARLNADGSLDNGFSPVVNNSVYALAVQSDGRILLGGNFTGIGASGRNGIARLGTNGAVDFTFDPGSGAGGPVNTLAVQSDGKVVLGGTFTSVNGVNLNNIARLLPTGALDSGFIPGTAANGPVLSLAVHPNGKIIIGGAFATYNGASRSRFARLKSDGSLDMLFNPGTGADASVQAVAVQPDTAVVLGGDFTQINGLPRNHIARIHGDERASLLTVEFAAARFLVWETNASALITVQRSGNTNTAFSIGYFTTDGTASNGVNYTGTTNTLNFAAGQTNQTFSIPVRDDMVMSGDLTVNLFLTNGPPSADLSGQSAAVLLIRDKERFVQFSGVNYFVDEGATNASVTLARTGGLWGPVSVIFSTSAGSATAGVDYSNVAVVVSFADNEATKSALVPIIDDNLPEAAETVNLGISNPIGATLGTPTAATLTIVDNDLVYGTNFYSSTNQILILDGSPASPYPSVINVSSLVGVVSKVTVTLVNLTHSFPADIEALLVGPAGQSVLLMSDAGGNIPVNGATLRFDDSVGSFLPQHGPIVTSTNKPTDYPPSDPFYSPAPSGPYSSSLSAFNGGDPNGAWSLYILDDRGSDAGVISNGWRLAVTTIDPARTNDLSLTMIDSPDPVMAGQPLSYHLLVTNNGPRFATGVIVADSLPPGVNVGFMKFSQGSCMNSNGTIICNLGGLPVGSYATVILSVTPNNVGTITNTATVTANETDIAPLNNSASAMTTVIPSIVADLSVSMTDAPDPVLAGQILTYTVTVTNNGPLTATGVLLTNLLPDNIKLNSVAVTQGSYAASGNQLVFNIGTLTNGGSAVATLVVQPETPGVITNTANAVADQLDTSPENLATALTTVTPGADLGLSVFDNVDPVAVSGNVTYVISIFNAGPNSAHGVTLFDTLPIQFSFISATSSQGSNVNASGIVIFDFGTLGSGSNVTATVVAKPQSPGTFTNSFVLIAVEGDPILANNSALETTTVITSGGGGGGNGIIVVPNTNATALAAAVTGSASSGINVTSASLVGHSLPGGEASSGLYFIGTPPATYGLVVPGIVLSSGSVTDYQTGTNTSTGFTTSYGNPATQAQNLLLDPITGVGTNRYRHFDATQLDIRFSMQSGYDHVTFHVVFGSEEYPEYVGSPFIDGFGIYLNGSNIAYVAGSPVNIDHPAMKGIPGTELDGVLAPGNDPILTFSAPVTPGSENNTLTFIVCDTSDSVLDTTVYISSLQGVLGAHADLSVNLTASPNPVVFGSNLTYRIAVTNRGPDTATNVVVSDTLPAGLNWVGATPSQGTCSFATGVVTCAVGDMPPGAIALINVLTTPATLEKITNLVTVASDVGDLNGTNNVSSNVVTVIELGIFSTVAPVNILDAGPSTPYPSVITVSGVTGVVSKVTVTLADLSHTFPADLDILLVGPRGQNVLLMSDAGAGFDLNSVKLKFDDDAAGYLPANSPIAAGTYKPTNIGDSDSFSPPAPGGPYGSALAVFNGTDPNGNWLLYIVDDQGLDSGVLATGWRLNITTIVQPALRIERSGGSVTLSWPASVSGYTLESRNSLSPADTWNPVGGTPSISGGRFTVSVSATGGSQFFRLRQ